MSLDLTSKPMKLFTTEYPKNISLNQLPNWTRPLYCIHSDVRPVFTFKYSNLDLFLIYDIQCRQPCFNSNCQLKKITDIYNNGIQNNNQEKINMRQLPDNLQQNCLFHNILPVIKYRNSNKTINKIEAVICKSRLCLKPTCPLKNVVLLDE